MLSRSPRPYGPLLGEAPLECDRLLEVERLEVAALGVGFKARERLRDRVDARLALPPRLLEVRKVIGVHSHTPHVRVPVSSSK